MSNRFDSIIGEKSRKYGVPFALVKAIIDHESGFNPLAKNLSDPGGGAWGLGQILLTTAKALAGFVVTPVMLLVPEFNIDLTARNLADGYRRYNGNVKDAMAYHNGGLVRKNAAGQYVNSKGVPNVQKYVDRVYPLYLKYSNETVPDPAPATGDAISNILDDSKKN